MAALEVRILIHLPKFQPERWGLSWGGWLDNRHGEWWLLAQLALIAAHLLPPWPAPGAWGYAWPLPLALAGAILLLLGLVLAVQAFWGLGSSLTPLPDPIPGAPLVTSGAYSRCRHPLYQAVLLCSLGVSLALGSLLHLALLLALAIGVLADLSLSWALGPDWASSLGLIAAGWGLFTALASRAREDGE